MHVDIYPIDRRQLAQYVFWQLRRRADRQWRQPTADVVLAATLAATLAAALSASLASTSVTTTQLRPHCFQWRHALLPRPLP